MHKTFHVPQRGTLATLADALILPVMPLVTPRGDSPQLTHWWNNLKTKRPEVHHLDNGAMVACAGDPDAKGRLGWWDVRFHLGGWSRYVVLEPTDCNDEWYVGWISGDRAGASQIPVSRRVRMLIEQNGATFFGVRATNYGQIRLHQIGKGRLGNYGPFRDVPLH